jgi:hypothetical protein
MAPCQDEPSSPRIPVDKALQVGQEDREPLDFVQNDTLLPGSCQKSPGIGFGEDPQIRSRE